MHAAVKLLYRDGVKIHPQWPPLLGQLQSGWHKTVPLLYLWPMEWVASADAGHRPLAVLWHPELVRVGHSELVLRGYEGIARGHTRRWCTQKWVCEVLDVHRARDYLGADRRFGEIQPSL
jgi:hypothetical protein